MTAFNWPPAAVDRLRALNTQGISSSQMARILGAEFGCYLTKNAVTGKRDRLGITSSPKRAAAIQAANAQRRTEQERIRREKAADTARRVTERAAARLAKLQRLQADQLPKEDNVIVLTTRIHPDSFALAPKVMMDPCFKGFRWPLERVADDGSMLFCCNATSDLTESYCAPHKARAFQKTRSPAQIAADAALHDARVARGRAMGLKNSLNIRSRRAAL